MSAPITRRELLKWASAGAGAAAVGGATYWVGRDDAPTQNPTAMLDDPDQRRPQVTAAPPPAPRDATAATPDLGRRLLVVVEMDGGNDGLSMLVPYGMGNYYDLRRSTAIAESEVLALDDEVGFNAGLRNVYARGAAVLQGVGTSAPDGSHFEMMARWWSGSPTPSTIADSGFLGRLADAIGDPAAAAVALSIGTGAHPAIAARSVSTLSIPDAYAAGYVTGAGDDDPFRRTFQNAFARFADGSGGSDLEQRMRSLRSRSVAFAETIGDLDQHEDGATGGYPDSGLGNGLRLAAQLFQRETGVRIVHVPMQVDFDTHDDHNGRYTAMMEGFDAATEAFFVDLEEKGLTDRVLLMTTSEFGRTARDNDSGGLDHGTASNVLLMGPVNQGRFGEHPSLTELDGNDDLIATVEFDQYYATVAEGWFGVPASDVLDGNVATIDGIFT